MNNKPGYSIFKNASYALAGFKHAFANETSFKIELFIAPFVVAAVWWLVPQFWERLLLIATFVLVMIAELLNSAVENVVDLCTQRFHPLAKAAKDIGATAVLFAVLLHLGCWIAILVHTYL